ncbi:hypothetical protein IB75_16660, partial [Nitrosococcus oceani C-27]
ENVEKQSVEKLSGVVHGWLTMQIVILAVFILVAAMGSNPLSSSGDNAPSQPPYALLFFSPVVSIGFMKMVQKMNYSNIPELEVKKILKFALPPVLIGIILVATGLFSNMHANAYILGISLVIASIWPSITFKK